MKPPRLQTLTRDQLGSAHGGGVGWIPGPKNVVPKRVLGPEDNFQHMVNHMVKSVYINAKTIPALVAGLEESLGPKVAATVRKSLDKLYLAAGDSASHVRRSIYRSNDLSP